MDKNEMERWLYKLLENEHRTGTSDEALQINLVTWGYDGVTVMIDGERWTISVDKDK